MDSRALSWMSAFVTKSKSPVTVVGVWVGTSIPRYRCRGLRVCFSTELRPVNRWIDACLEPVMRHTSVAAECGGRDGDVVDDRDSA